MSLCQLANHSRAGKTRLTQPWTTQRSSQHHQETSGQSDVLRAEYYFLRGDYQVLTSRLWLMMIKLPSWTLDTESVFGEYTRDILIQVMAGPNQCRSSERIARNGRIKSCFRLQRNCTTDTLMTITYPALCGNAHTKSDINTVNYCITSLSPHEHGY